MARPKEEILSRVKYTVSASKAESTVWEMAKEMTESPAGGAAVAASIPEEMAADDRRACAMR